MIRAFVDASVLFAAAYSPTGASREILHLGIRGEIRLVASDLIFEEARRNLRAKAPQAIPPLERFLEMVGFELVRPTKAEVLAAMEFTAVKDAPVVAAARKAQVDYLLSLDRRHLVGVDEVARQSGLRIVLPSECLAELRDRSGGGQ